MELQLKGEAPGGWHRWNFLPILLILVLLSVYLQIQNGVYSSDFGADPDEPAHVVTSLMMRDYLVTGIWRGEFPMAFAQRYYEAFPKVALGHYPPGFYLVAGLWLIPVASKSALMLLVAVLTASAGLVSIQIGKNLRLKYSLFAGIWFVMLPLTQKQSMLVMSDILLCTCLLLSVCVFARFLDRPTAKYALLFGVLAAVTILTKASGVALALVPLLAIALTGRWKLFANWRLWLAPVPVLLTAVPWTLLTYKITQEGMADKSIVEYLPAATFFYLTALIPALGSILVIGSVSAISISIFHLVAKKNNLSHLAAVLTAMTVSILALYLVSPTGMSTRYLLPLAPVAIIATIWSIERVMEVAGHRYTGGGLIMPLVFCTLIALTVMTRAGWRTKNISGFSAAAERLLSVDSRGGSVLISSDARGEGALTAELAMRIFNRSNSSWKVKRASKYMASSDWIGRNYELKLANSESLVSAMKRDQVEWIVHDNGIPSSFVTGHNTLIAHLLNDPSKVEIIARIASKRESELEASELLVCRLK